MCGIVGFINCDTCDDKSKVIESMMDKITHRGPDSQNHFEDDSVALGFCRLSIIDLERGSQPMYSDDGNFVIIFNGEIYNYRELRAELEAKGHVFHTTSDTEVLLKSYVEYGDEVVHHLRGMFGFAVWDKQRKRLFAARDMFGIKPFYYAQMNNTFFFGSEIKSFLPHPQFVKEFNDKALKPYLIFQYSVLNETFFKNVFKLDPGHSLVYENGELNITRYHRFEFKPVSKTVEQWVADIHDTVQESVNAHTVSDVPVGSFLSGGVDSSYITNLLHPQKTFSVGFEVNGFNEVSDAKALCDILGIENVHKMISSQEFLDAIPRVQYYSDEPHANLSAVPLYYLAQLARQHVTVVLSGEGADELFAGYDPYVDSPFVQKYRKLPVGLRRVIGRIARKMPNIKGKQFFIRNESTVEESFIGQARIFETENAVDTVLQKPYVDSASIRDIVTPYFDEVAGLDDLTKKQYLDLHLWQPYDILLKADKMTMAHSLELRVPFLDKKVWSLASSIPSSIRVSQGVSKHMLRTAALRDLPQEWAKRKKKGFMVPFRVWLTKEQGDECYNYVREIFSRDYAEQFFKRETLMTMLEEHYQGIANHARKIYTIMCFLVWYDVYFVSGQ